MNNLDPKRARWMKVRMVVLATMLAGGMSSVIASAYNIQVKHGAEWRMIAERQRNKKLNVTPSRGSIYDRNGEVVAVSIDVPSVAVNVVEMLRGVPEPRASALLEANIGRLSHALTMSVDDIRAKVKGKKRFAWLKRRISQPEVDALKKLIDPKSSHPMKGIMIEGEGHRFYPGREALWGLIGFVSSDGVGIDGIEKAYDDELRGRHEKINALRDRKGTLLFGNTLEDERALAGDDLHLAVDLGLQFQVQEDLEAGVKAFEAKSGSAVIMDPHTGEILAMVTAPAYNANDYADSPVEARKHHAINDRYEPGSTMKVFTVAVALAEGKVKPTETFFVENGLWEIGGKKIRDTHPDSVMTPSQIIAKSSNIGAGKIGLQVGEAGLYQGFKRFGFGEPTGLDLPGEATGVLRVRGRPWYDIEVAYASFGHGISITNLQMTMAMCAIANGGKLIEPVLVKRVTSSTGTPLREEGTTIRREAVPTHVTRLVTEMMLGVTEDGGTAKEASIPGYRVAGKTGTAAKIDLETGRYDENKFVASFIGFVPANKPRFVISVSLDEPWISHLAGQVAAPIFRRIAMRALSRYGIAPSGDVARTPVNFPMEDPTPKVYAASRHTDSTLQPTPFGGTESSRTVQRTIHQVRDSSQAVVVPDMKGWPARDAVRALASVGLSPVLLGSGIVQRHDPVASSVLQKGSSVKLYLQQPD